MINTLRIELFAYDHIEIIDICEAIFVDIFSKKLV